MTNIQISINPLAEYLEATTARKLKILEEQQNPDPVRIPYWKDKVHSLKDLENLVWGF